MLASLDAIEELDMRAGAARERLAGEAAGVARELEALLVAMLHAEQRSRGALLGCALALARDEALAARLSSSAQQLGLAYAARMLGDAPPARALAHGGRLREARASEGTAAVDVPPMFVYSHGDAGGPESDRWVRHWMPMSDSIRQAWRASAVELTALDHPSPRVRLRLLAARGTPRKDVLRVASRRPTTPELAAVLARSARWMAFVDVREALVKNPFTPTGLALRYLPTCRASAWRELAGHTPSHALVKAAARALCAETAPR